MPLQPSCSQHVWHSLLRTIALAALASLTAAQADSDVLTVMNYNTYLLKVKVIFVVREKPDMEVRSAGIIDWFNKVDGAAMPDILVLNEIFSAEGERVVQGLCTDEWRKNGDPSSLPKWWACKSWSKFGFATRAVNPTTDLATQKCGGVVVLVKRGLSIQAAQETKFPIVGSCPSCDGAECCANKGFWTVQVMKGQQLYWVLGTHTAGAGDHPDEFPMIRDHIRDHIPEGARWVLAGDLNCGDKCAVGLLKELGSGGTPASRGTLVQNGFWLPLPWPLTASMDKTHNWYTGSSAMLDHVITPAHAASGTHTGPRDARFQVVPVRSQACFFSEEEFYTNDLSDHFGIFSQLCYSGACPNLTSVAQQVPGDCRRKLASDSTCSKDAQCEGGACARPQAGTDDLHCCPSGRSGVFAGFSYCYGMGAGTKCWSDAMCASGFCQGNAGGLQKGACFKKLAAGAGCNDDQQCLGGACARPRAGTDDLHCCPSGRSGVFAGFSYCYGMGAGTKCWSDAMCAGGTCKGNWGGLRKGTCN